MFAAFGIAFDVRVLNVCDNNNKAHQRFVPTLPRLKSRSSDTFECIWLCCRMISNVVGCYVFLSCSMFAAFGTVFDVHVVVVCDNKKKDF